MEREKLENAKTQLVLLPPYLYSDFSANCWYLISFKHDSIWKHKHFQYFCFYAFKICNAGPKYLFFFPSLANISWYKWLEWLIFLKGHYISLAYFLTIHITEGCLQLWAKQREYCHPHDQASKETTLLSYRKKDSLFAQTLVHFPVSCQSLTTVPAPGGLWICKCSIHPSALSHRSVIILWFNHFCFLILLLTVHLFSHHVWDCSTKDCGTELYRKAINYNAKLNYFSNNNFMLSSSSSRTICTIFRLWQATLRKHC